MEPLNLLRSTSPETPLTRPVAVYCQMVYVGKPAGMLGLVVPQWATQG